MDSSEKEDQFKEIQKSTAGKTASTAKYKRNLIGGLSIVLIILFLFSFLPRLIHTLTLDGKAAKKSYPLATIVQVQPDDKPIEFKLPSSTQANHITPIWARANGYLVDLCVDIGDVVKQGDLLAVLDTPDVDAQYIQALHDLDVARSNRDIAKITADRWQSIYECDSKAIAKEEVDEKVASYVSAEAFVAAQAANMEHYKDLMNFKYIIAPFDGVIIERNVDLGSLITAGNGAPQQLFVIAESDIIRLFVNVPQYYFRLIHEGLEAAASIREFQGKSFTSKVARYAKALDPTARTMLTELHIDNKSGQLFPGLFAEATFRFTPDVAYFTVPQPAVIIRAGKPKIACLDAEDKVHMKTVEIGIDNGATLQIVAGLEANDRIITNPTEKIKEGVKVKIVKNDK